MGITRLKNLLTDDLSRAFTTQELKHFILNLNIDIDLYSLTGYPKNSPIPRREAAQQIVEYIYKTNRMLQLLNLYINSTESSFKGEQVVYNNQKQVFQEMFECGFKYNKELKKVVLVEQEEKRPDWGFLKDGTIYSFCFLMIDVCKNTKLVRKYDQELIRQTYINFKNYIKSIIESYNGRIWMWEGDGGLIVFHIKDFVNQAVLSAIKILSNMPVFNLTLNNLDDDILIRIAMTSGSTEFKKNILMINSESINEVRKVEKDHTLPMTISVTKHTFPHININIRKFLTKTEINNMEIYQLKLPIIGERIES